MWIEKSDFIERYYETIKGKYENIDESIDYYMGMLELSILLLNKYQNYHEIGYLEHKKINKDSLNNPLNIKIDVKERDFAEYLKYLFFSNQYKSINISDLIINNKNNYNFNLVISRIIYPNYYFDIVDEILLEKENQRALLKIISRNKEYEKYIEKIIKTIKKIYPLETDISLS